MQGVKKWIETAMEEDPRLKDIISWDSFGLYLNNVIRIPDRHWDSVIRPGACVTLRTLNSKGGYFDYSAKRIFHLPPLSLLTTESENVQIIDSRGDVYLVPFTACHSYAVSKKTSSNVGWISTHHLYFAFLYCSTAMLSACVQDLETVLREDIYSMRNTRDSSYYCSDEDLSLKPHIVTIKNGCRILPSVWEHLIEPGMVVKLFFPEIDEIET